MNRSLPFLAVVLLLAGYPAAPRATPQAPARAAVSPPKEHFGFDIGDDYCLANYKQFASYFRKVEGQTDRLKVVSIGKTEEGRDQIMGIVTSPANHKKLGRYREIARKLARAEGVTADEARKLADEGKAVIWIDGGLHASEVLCAQALVESVYRLVTADDPETLRVLDDVIVLFVHCNPDGMDLCADWYMRDKDPKRRSLGQLPRLYQKYCGHDNNRDFYANTQAETKNMNRVMYREWFPQVVLNHHQTGPAGTVMFIPPCRDPFNYNIHPMVINGIERVSGAMVERFLAEDKPGVTIRTGARYSTWFNGGLSTACQFHNMIGLFTETIGGPTPSQVPLLANKQLPTSDYLAPIPPQPWRFRQSVEYVHTANRALLDYASRNRSLLLHNIWVMGKQSIDHGSRDHWSITPKVVGAAGGRAAAPAGGGGGGGGGFGQGFRQGGGGQGAAEFAKTFHDPAKRDARGYVIPADQPDFLTATKFVNTLIGTGVTVHRATDALNLNDKLYPKGTYVVKSAQAFRAHIFDMFEPQDHPDDFAAGSTTPTPPYDMAGWTLAFQMGVQFDRILDAFEGPFEELKDEVAPPAAKVGGADSNVTGYFLDTRMNDSFRAVNRLLAAGEDVRRLTKPLPGNRTVTPAGTFFITAKKTTRPLLEKLAAELGTPFSGTTATLQADDAVAIKPVRVGLWDRYGGSMPAGWARWVLERFEFPFKVVYPPHLDRGGLREQYDVLIFPDGAIAGRGGGGFRPKGGDGPARDLPEEFRGLPGSVTTEVTVPHLKEFLKEGGTIIAIGSSTSLAGLVGVTLPDHLVQKDAEGKEKPLGRDKFYVPGSVLRARVDAASPLAWGMDEAADVMFASSPAFRPPADGKDVTRVAWYDGKAPLRSGWAWGQEHLDGGVAVAEAAVGKGKLVLCGPQVLFRGQPHGTFKFVFNGIVQAGAGRADD
jgi:hypothetical protein